MYTMKRYTVSKARESLAELLNEVERGGIVVIERRDVEYEIRPRPSSRKRAGGRALIETLDPGIASGQWSWAWKPEGLRLRAPRRRP